MNLMKTIAGSSDQLDHGMDPEVMEGIKDEVRSVMCRFLLRGIYAPLIAGFVISFACFYAISPDEVITWKIVLTIVWSFKLAFFIDAMFWSIGTCVIVTFITTFLNHQSRNQLLN